MKKRILAVFTCVLTLLMLCTLFAFAEDAGDSEAIWDFWSLLKLENLDVAQLLVILITTVVTFVRMISGGGLKELGAMLLQAIKNLIPIK